MKNAAVAALFTLSAWGCTLTDAQTGPEGDTSQVAAYRARRSTDLSGH